MHLRRRWAACARLVYEAIMVPHSLSKARIIAMVVPIAMAVTATR
jgi:hypothetical protein